MTGHRASTQSNMAHMVAALFERSLALAAHMCINTAAHAASRTLLPTAQARAVGCDARGRAPIEPSRAGVPTPARTPSGHTRPLARLAHAGAPHPCSVTRCFRPDGPASELPDEDLAHLVVGLEPRSNAPAGKLPVASMAAHEDEAVEVVEGAKVDGAAVAGQIAGQIVAAQRSDAGLREHCSGTASYATDNLIT